VAERERDGLYGVSVTAAVAVWSRSVPENTSGGQRVGQGSGRKDAFIYIYMYI